LRALTIGVPSYILFSTCFRTAFSFGPTHCYQALALPHANRIVVAFLWLIVGDQGLSAKEKLRAASFEFHV
jgi:hypothetical protein